MVVGVGSLELYLPACHSLKEKRSVVRRVLDRVRNRFPVSAAEVDHQDLHQRASLGFAVVSADARVAESVLHKVEAFVVGLHLAEVIASDREVIRL